VTAAPIKRVAARAFTVPLEAAEADGTESDRMSITQAPLRRQENRTADGRVRIARVSAPGLSPRRLAAELAGAIEGEVRFDDGSRALYSTDVSNYRQVPIGVVLPRNAQDVERAVAICRRHGAPLLSRGGGTGLSGQTTNTAVVLDFSKYLNRVLEIDPERCSARVQPGCILHHLRDAAGAHDRYEVAQRIAERGLFPELRATPRQSWVIADGFSCREQIEQGTGRGTVHIAQSAAACLRSEAR
jgi:hypothetical protein